MKQEINHKKSLILNLIATTLLSGIWLGMGYKFIWVIYTCMKFPPDKFNNRLLFVSLAFIILSCWLLFNLIPIIWTMCLNDLKEVEQMALRIFPEFYLFNKGQQTVIMDMLFNMGINRFLGFKDFIAQAKLQNVQGMIEEMIDSKWFGQVKSRGPRLINTLKGGY